MTFITISRKTETRFVIATMLFTLGFAIVAAINDWGYQSANWLAFGMYTCLSAFALWKHDLFLMRLLVFGLIAGFVELVADNWLVNGIHSLVYPATETRLWASPVYMPFAWAVVLVQVGYLSSLLVDFRNPRHLPKAILVSFGVGMCFIPVFETCAKFAGWWYYQETTIMLFNTPLYIILGEGLICLSLPVIFNKTLHDSWMGSVFAGILQGLWIFVAYFLSYQLLKTL